MQLFYLLSFVVVASYAAALPQPAGLSEQYSNNVDTNLASILKARSYQPVLDIREDSPTLMSLERRAGSARSFHDQKVGDGIAKLSENGEKVKTKIVGPAGEMLALYLRRSTYVNLALTSSASNGLNATFSFIRSTTTPAEFSKAVRSFIVTFKTRLLGLTKRRQSQMAL
ncbi:hypothetical protein BASA50_010415 [Batrachochytrium salamandrivorans]|uniref:Uncharacterized protein n=1 Tax=Batrachochytrium salamandrivorans TaxID=1357716 RepID=A0ABQ8EYJ1_9FUNG|nr:hypothetical protein BASA50_010415 [Batrachochytrium salamandrivorans]